MITNDWSKNDVYRFTENLGKSEHRRADGTPMFLFQETNSDALYTPDLLPVCIAYEKYYSATHDIDDGDYDCAS